MENIYEIIITKIYFIITLIEKNLKQISLNICKFPRSGFAGPEQL
jgi:hypothetical protein